MAGCLFPIPRELNAAAVEVRHEMSRLESTTGAASELKFGYRDCHQSKISFILRVGWRGSRATLCFQEPWEAVWFMRGVARRIARRSRQPDGPLESGERVKNPQEAAAQFGRGINAADRLMRNARPELPAPTPLLDYMEGWGCG